MLSLKGPIGRTGQDAALVGAGTGPEVLRRRTIRITAQIVLGSGVLALVPALYGFATGFALPLILVCLVLAGGLTALSMSKAGQHDSAIAAEVATLFATGMVLTIADPAPVDAGLATAVMAPVLAALLSRGFLRQASWAGLLAVFTIGFASHALELPSVPIDQALLAAISAIGFIQAFVVVAYVAHQINTAFEVHDKAQLGAYRHLVEHLQDAVLRFGDDGRVQLASRSSEALFGCPRYQLAGETLIDRIHVLDRPAFLSAFADASRAGKGRNLEMRVRQEDPSARSQVPRFLWTEIQLAPIAAANAPGAGGVIGMLRDITDRKDAEAAMAEARRSAEEASEAKSRFLATIGHELRTPLNAVVGFSEMMTAGIGGELSSTHKEYAGLIRQSGRHLLDVVGMLLDMSRIEAGKFDVDAEPILPGDLVPACLAMVETMADARSVEIVADVEPDLPLLVADERVCRQILINLLSNAIKFSHEGGLVSVAVKRQGQSINFSVRDRGIGMSAVALERIGEPFFQVHDGLTRKYEGTGLGLSIVKGLVELHGGTLRAMSELGVGTTFTVLLPINGPATKAGETAEIVPLHREPPAADLPSWQNEKRKAQ